MISRQCVGRFFDLSDCQIWLNEALEHVTNAPRCEPAAIQVSTLPEIIWRNHVAESLRDSEIQCRGATLPHPFTLKLAHGCLAGQRHVSDGFLISVIARYSLTASRRRLRAAENTDACGLPLNEALEPVTKTFRCEPGAVQLKQLQKPGKLVCSSVADDFPDDCLHASFGFEPV